MTKEPWIYYKFLRCFYILYRNPVLYETEYSHLRELPQCSEVSPVKTRV